MARITVEDCLEQENNRFALVLLAAKRSKQILSGNKTLLDESRNKAVVTALREIAAGKVRFMTEEERRLAEEKRLEDAERARQQAAANAERAAAAKMSTPTPDSLFKELPTETTPDSTENGNGTGENTLVNS